MSETPSPSPPALHRRIRADLETNIRSGTWPPGFRLPTEQALMVRYGCARMTVSRAMASLSQAGLVERRKRAGSFVARAPLQTAVLEIPDIPALIATRGGEAYRFQRFSRQIRPPNAKDRDEAALAAPGLVLAVRGLHLAADVPFALESRVINLAAVPSSAALPFDREPPGTWLLKHIAWTSARHRISAINADADAAGRLGIRRGLACLAVERWTWRESEWITFVRQTFPADRYSLVATFGP